MKITDEMVNAAKRIRDTAMEQTMAARIPESGHFGAIAQDADWLVDHLTACQQEVERLRAEVNGLKAEPFDTREGLSKWRGWDDSNYPWSQTHHKDSVLEAMFRDSWSVEDAAALLGFIERTWGEQSNEA